MKRIGLIKDGMIINTIVVGDDFSSFSEYFKQYEILELSDKPGSPDMLWIKNKSEDPKIPDDGWIVKEYLVSLKDEEPRG
jgi:hypothetical protein